jgi:hypothetical protein
MIIKAKDAMFVWTPNRKLYRTKNYPLRGMVHVTTNPESSFTRQHPMSSGACNGGWETVDGRHEMAQRLVDQMIHEDNIPEDVVRRAFMQTDEFSSFPFSTKRRTAIRK